VSDRVDLGAFTVGEIPFPLTYAFTTESGTAINLTGYTAQFQWGERSNATSYTNATTEPASVSDAVGGVVSYTWTGDEFLIPGRYAGMFWVGDGANRLASELHVWVVCLAVDVPPSI
jgi:hypothetical protein